jgi:hypothetical protein
VVNATGIVKQRSAASQSIPSIEINALFPHSSRYSVRKLTHDCCT